MARKYFDVLKDKSTPADALDQWLADPIISMPLDPIAYWSGMLAVAHPLARMALDFMSIPSTLHSPTLSGRTLADSSESPPESTRVW